MEIITDDERERMGLGPRTRPTDPAYHLLTDSYTSSPVVHREGCYICEDPEFAQMGLPLCKPCPKCKEKDPANPGHVAADDTTCDVCGYDVIEEMFPEEEA